MISQQIENILKAKERFAARKVGGELVLVPLKNSVAEMEEMFTLNEVGSLIWEDIQKGTTEQTLIDAIVNEFDIDPFTASEDLQAFLDSLSTHLKI